MGETDWTVVMRAPCPECGLDVSAVAASSLATRLVEEADRWVRLLVETPHADLLRRSDEGVWCALEYGAHVRDVFGLFAERVVAMLTTNAPTLGWWDHEAAATEQGYADQDPEAVGAGLDFNAERLIDVISPVPEDAWERTAIRRPGENFTVIGLVRFAIHESAHHRGDAERSIRS